MNWTDIAGVVGKSAPLLGTLLGGPAGAAIGGLVASALGTGSTPEDVQAALTANPEAFVQLRQLEAEKQMKLQELINVHAENQLRVAADDRKDARSMQVSTRSRVPAILSFGVTAGYFTILIGMLDGRFHVNDSQVLLIMLGSLGTAFGAVMAYWLGTTADSGRKTELLALAPSTKAAS